MRVKEIVGGLVCAILLTLAAGTVPAQAERELLKAFVAGKEEFLEPPKGGIEGACGLAFAPENGNLFVSDYYHHLIAAFHTIGDLAGEFAFSIDAPPPPGVPPAVPPEGPCGLALHAETDSLYANYWHESVVRLSPAPIQTFDKGKATGVAVDEAGRVYVNDRTYVAVYEPSGVPVLHEGLPLRIGLGSLGDAYGLAVDPAGARVYVPDAADDAVEVYEPAGDPLHPVSSIAGPDGLSFASLVDAAVTVDPTNDHLLVVDNLQFGYEQPKAAVYEFDASGEFLGRLPGRRSESQPWGLVHGEPSGLAVDPKTGKLFVTTGNGEGSNALEYGPYVPGAPLAAQPLGETPTSTPGGPFTSVSGPTRGTSVARSAATASEIVQRRGVRVSFDGKLTPRALPRHGAAPVGIAVDVRIAAADGDDPPQLRRIAIEINRHGHFDSLGLPLCRLRDIQPSTTINALAACRRSLVGEGHFSADVKLPEQSPFPSEGKVLAFNGHMQGRPAILAHIYGTKPVPTSYVLPFLIAGAQGTYGTTLDASLPQATGDWGYVTGLRMTLRRRFSHHGRGRSYLSAGCPAPAGFPSVVFPLARTSFSFAGGMTLVSTLSRSCKARG